MRTVAVAYRSLHPERTSAAIKDAEAAREAAIEAMTAFTEDLLGPGFVMVGSHNFDGSIWPTGFTRDGSFTRDTDVKPGLRFDAKKRELVPAKRTDEGRAMVARLDALAFRHPYIDGLGGIVHAKDGDRGYFTGWSFDVFAGEVFATLSVPTLDEGSQKAAIAESWTPVPLSEFHAAREQVTA